MAISHAEDGLPSEGNSLSKECPCLSITQSLAGAGWKAWHQVKAVMGFREQHLEIKLSFASCSHTAAGFTRACFVLTNPLSGTNCIHACVLSRPVMFNSLRPLDCSPPGSSVHGIPQARILERVDISSSVESSWPRDPTRISCIGRWILYHWATWEAAH